MRPRDGDQWSIILIGLSGAGKSTVAAKLGDALGLPIFEVGAVVTEEARAADQPALEYADAVFQQGDHLHFVERVASRAGPGAAIVVGPRRPDEIRYLRDTFAPATVVALRASFDTRCWRKRDCIGTDAFLHRDSVERSWGFDETFRSADFVADAERDLPSVLHDILQHWRSVAVQP